MFMIYFRQILFLPLLCWSVPISHPRYNYFFYMSKHRPSIETKIEPVISKKKKPLQIFFFLRNFNCLFRTSGVCKSPLALTNDIFNFRFTRVS